MLAGRVRMAAPVGGDHDDIWGTPGALDLVAGDMTAGFFGEVPANQLITGTNLNAMFTWPRGTALNTNAGWLKFAWQGNVQFVAKMALRRSLQWPDCDSAGVIDGTNQVIIGGFSYKVRVLRTGTTDPLANTGGNQFHGSEWNRLILPILAESATSSWATPDNVENNLVSWGIGYTSTNLGLNAANGGRSWCLETDGSVYNWYRGGVDGSTAGLARGNTNVYGWRPVIELVQP